MKRFVGRTVFTVLSLLSTYVGAQDVTVKQSSEQLIGRAVALNSDSVNYQRYSYNNEPKFAKVKQEIVYVKPAISEKPELQVLESSLNELPLEVSVTVLQMQAKTDAKAYYKPKGVFLTTLGSTVMHPVAGLVTGTLFAAVPPNIDNQINPNRYLLKEPEYRETYLKQAKKRKIGNAAAGFGAGAAVIGLVYLAVIVSIVGI